MTPKQMASECDVRAKKNDTLKYQLDNTLIVIPAYNEEDSLETTLDELLDTLPKCRYLVINDGSTDKTGAICRARGFEYLNLPVNVGLAGAFQAGIKYAFRYGFDYVIQFDADGQHDPRFINDLMARAEHYDIIIGSRFLGQKKTFSLRMIGSDLIATSIRLTTGITIKDPTSGMRLFGTKAIKAFATDTNCGPEPDTLSYLLKKKNATIFEVPVTMRERLAGTSYLNAKAAILYMLRMTLSIVVIQFFRR